MKYPIVTTNVRMLRDHLVEYRTLAAEMDVSFNELVLRALKVVTQHPQLLTQSQQSQPKVTVWDLPVVMKQRPASQPLTISADDEVIYG